MIGYLVLFLFLAAVVYLLFRTHKPRKEELIEGTEPELNLYGLDWPAVEARFPYKREISKITIGTANFLERERDVFEVYPPMVNPYAFALAVRQAEGGRAGREFGVMHKDALDTDFETQMEWFLLTFRNDTRRWHQDKLIHVGGRTRKDFVDFTAYFSAKYAPPGGVANDPNNLNRHHEGNIRRFYNLYRKGA